MKFLQWLDKKEASSIPEQKVADKKKKKLVKKSVLSEKIFEVENGVIDITSIEVEEPIVEKFIHPETGKEYKTARALKAGITRYNKKSKKEISKLSGERDWTKISNDDVENEMKELIDKSEAEHSVFIDTETGKTYKTASGLKAGITRRLKKQKKSKNK